MHYVHSKQKSMQTTLNTKYLAAHITLSRNVGFKGLTLWAERT